MAKLLVTHPSGLQEVIEVGPGGDFYDPSRVDWDDRIHGTLPVEKNEVGGWKRQGGVLVLDHDKKAAHDLVKAKEVSEADKVKARMDKMKKLKDANSVEKVKDVLSAVLEHLGIDHG